MYSFFTNRWWISIYIYIYDSRHCHFKKATGLWEQPWSELHGDSDGLCQPSFLCPHIHSHCVGVPDRHQWQHATVPAPPHTVLGGGERSQWDICREHYCHRQGQWQVWRDYLLPSGHKWWPESHHWLQNSMFSFILSKTPCQSQFDLLNHDFLGDKYLIKYSLIGIASRFLQFGKFKSWITYFSNYSNHFSGHYLCPQAPWQRNEGRVHFVCDCHWQYRR